SEGITGFVVANELLDNLPFERIRRTKHGLVQVAVDMRGDGFAEVEMPCDAGLLAFEPLALDEGREIPVSEAALSMIDRLARVLDRGYALFIDYGDAGG